MPEYSDFRADPAEYMPLAEGADVGRGAGAPQPNGPIEAIVEYIGARGYTFEPWQIATFVTALRTKPFLILAGISGTGKTRLPHLVADATGAKVRVVPVRPDWTDSSDLLGYERLDNTFVPGALLRVCKDAMDEPNRQFFFVLDEMNVARVEYYFAEVLSLMENRERAGDGTLRTKPLNENATGSQGAGAPPWAEVYLPSNVSIIGTVNMDETTHGFSRKVLDRAFVLEFSEVDLGELGVDDPTAAPPYDWPASAWAPAALRLAESGATDDAAVIDAVSALVRANGALSKAQLQVGFRVRDEVALFCLASLTSPESFVESDGSLVSPLDLCLSMKVLPRVQGGGALIRSVLDDLATWLDEDDVAGSAPSPHRFPKSLARVELMRDRLDLTGFTSFWI